MSEYPSRLQGLIDCRMLTPEEAEVIFAAPRVVERLELMSAITPTAAKRPVRVARAWSSEYELQASGRPRKHYTRYNAAILEAVKVRIGESKEILDPMAGTMERLRTLEDPANGWHLVHGVEYEQEWVDGYPHPRLVQGDARDLPYPDASFDVIVVSPSYGNRDSDRSGDWWDNPDRKTYAAALGRNPSRGSLCVPFQDPYYRQGHTLAWAEAVRVLRPGGLFVINLKNHMAGGVIQRVSQWHKAVLRDTLRMQEVDDTSVAVSGRHSGAHTDVRAEQTEKIYIFSRPQSAGAVAASVAAEIRKEHNVAEG